MLRGVQEEDGGWGGFFLIPISPYISPTQLHFEGVSTQLLAQKFHINLWFSSNFKHFAEPSLTLKFGIRALFMVENLS